MRGKSRYWWCGGFVSANRQVGVEVSGGVELIIIFAWEE